MHWDFQHIFLTPPIEGSTINFVFLSPEFRIIEYSLIAFILVASTLYSLIKKNSFLDAFGKAVIVAFFTSGLLYAIHADIGWAKWLMTDVKNYQGLSTEQKLEKLDGNLYKFTLQAKKIIHADYQIYTSDEYLYYRTQYYLLPLVRHEQAPYIIVIADNQANFYPGKSLFTRGETTITNVEQVFVFAKNAYILKRL
jgi:hypothetical protein